MSQNESLPQAMRTLLMMEKRDKKIQHEKFGLDNSVQKINSGKILYRENSVQESYVQRKF